MPASPLALLAERWAGPSGLAPWPPASLISLCWLSARVGVPAGGLGVPTRDSQQYLQPL